MDIWSIKVDLLIDNISEKIDFNQKKIDFNKKYIEYDQIYMENRDPRFGFVVGIQIGP